MLVIGGEEGLGDIGAIIESCNERILAVQLAGHLLYLTYVARIKL